MASNREKFQLFWKGIQARYDANPDKPVIVRGHTVKCDYKRVGKNALEFCIDTSERDWLAEELCSKPKTDEWLDEKDVAEETGLPTGYFSDSGKTLLSILFSNAEEDYATTFLPPIIDSHELNCSYRVPLAKKGGQEKQDIFCVHRSELSWIKEKIQRAFAPDGTDYRTFDNFSLVLTSPDDRHISDCNDETDSKRLQNIFDQMHYEFDSSYWAQQVSFNGKNFPASYVGDSKNAWFAVHKDAWPLIETHLNQGKPYGEKTTEWCEKREFTTLIGLGRNEANDEKSNVRNTYYQLWNKIRQQYEANPLQPVLVNGHKVQCGYKITPFVHWSDAQNGVRKDYDSRVFCVHESEAEWINEQIGNDIVRPSVPAGWYSEQDIRLILASYISYGSFVDSESQYMMARMEEKNRQLFLEEKQQGIGIYRKGDIYGKCFSPALVEPELQELHRQLENDPELLKMLCSELKVSSAPKDYRLRLVPAGLVSENEINKSYEAICKEASTGHKIYTLREAVGEYFLDKLGQFHKSNSNPAGLKFDAALDKVEEFMPVQGVGQGYIGRFYRQDMLDEMESLGLVKKRQITVEQSPEMKESNGIKVQSPSSELPNPIKFEKAGRRVTRY